MPLCVANVSHPFAEVKKSRCEFCGRYEQRYSFKGSQRFCSIACAKRYNVGCTRRMNRCKTILSSRRGRGGSVSQAPNTRRTWKQRLSRTEEAPPTEPVPPPLASPVGVASSSSTSPPLPPEPADNMVADTPSDTDGSSSPSARETASSAPRSPPELERVEMEEERQEEEMPPPPSNAHPSRWNVSASVSLLYANIHMNAC